jgi:hypothetical protein
MRTAVLAWWVRRVCVYPSLSRIQPLDFALGEVTKGNGSVNERRRFETAVSGIRASGGSGRVGEKVDALKRTVFG